MKRTSAEMAVIYKLLKGIPATELVGMHPVELATRREKRAEKQRKEGGA